MTGVGRRGTVIVALEQEVAADEAQQVSFGAAAVSVAGRGRGRRRDRHPGPVPAQSAGGHPVLPQVVERTRLCPSATDHRQTPQLPRGLPHRDAVRGPLHGPVREQPGRSLSPANPGAGASDAPVQICCPRATISLGARPHSESLSCRPPPPAGRPSSALVNTGLRCLARGDLRLKLKNGSSPHRGRSLPVQRQLDCEHDSSACRGHSVTLVGAGGR